MKAVEQIKTLMNNVKEIRTLFIEKIPLWASDKKTYDKTRWGFKEGGSDGWYKSCETTIHFEAWMGVYGDSSTYKQIDMNGEVWKKHFLKYLNTNEQSIMLAVADSMEKEAVELKAAAEKELQDQLDTLKELDSVS